MAEALPAASRPARAAGPATLWRHPDFLKLWSAQTISVFGDNFTALALPLLAAITWAAHTLVPPPRRRLEYRVRVEGSPAQH